MVSASGYSAFRLVFGSNPVGLYGWGDQDENLLLAQDSSVSEQFAQRWKLRMMAQEVALKEVANGKLRRLLAYNTTSNCTDAKNGDTVLFNEAQNRKRRPKWRNRGDRATSKSDLQGGPKLRAQTSGGGGGE